MLPLNICFYSDVGKRRFKQDHYHSDTVGAGVLLTSYLHFIGKSQTRKRLENHQLLSIFHLGSGTSPNISNLSGKYL